MSTMDMPIYSDFFVKWTLFGLIKSPYGNRYHALRKLREKSPFVPALYGMAISLQHVLLEDAVLQTLYMHKEIIRSYNIHAIN